MALFTIEQLDIIRRLHTMGIGAHAVVEVSGNRGRMRVPSLMTMDTQLKTPEINDMPTSRKMINDTKSRDTRTCVNYAKS